MKEAAVKKAAPAHKKAPMASKRKIMPDEGDDEDLFDEEEDEVGWVVFVCPCLGFSPPGCPLLCLCLCCCLLPEQEINTNQKSAE